MTPPRPPERPAGSTSSQLRDDIDRGRTGDKVPGEDPAAAPLGTDDEAAGASPSLEDVELDRRTARRISPGISPSREARRGAAPGRAAWPALSILAAVVAAILFVLLVL